jgi:hypothetical protein
MLVNFYQTTKHNIPEDISPFLTMVWHNVYNNSIGLYSLSKCFLIKTTFWKLVILLSSGQRMKLHSVGPLVQGRAYLNHGAQPSRVFVLSPEDRYTTNFWNIVVLIKKWSNRIIIYILSYKWR